MGVQPAVFQSGGQISQHYIPGGYSRLNFVKGAGGLVSASNGVIIGDCRGGEPNKLLWFRSPAEAKETLREGPLLDAMRLAFNPGEGLVPQRLASLRVNPGLQASRILKNGSDTMIDVPAWDWGLHTNQVKMKLEAGTTSGKKLSVQFQLNEAVVEDNVEKESFEIQYSGAGTAATMTITKTQLTTTCTGASEDDLTILFSAFPTIEDIVNYINDQANYSCTIKTSNPKDKSIELDSVSAEDIKTSAYTALSDLQAIIDQLNVMPWIGEAAFHDASTSRLVPDNDTDWVYFSGGTDGEYTADEWAVSLTALQNEDIQLVSSPVTDESIHTLIKNHCELMNSVNGRNERQFLLGGAAGETVAQVIIRAKALSSESGMLCDPDFYAFDGEGIIQTYAPSYYACMQMAQYTCLALSEPTTNKQVNILGWATQRTDPEVEEQIKNGVCVGFKNKAGRLVTARSLTTYQGSDLQRCEFSIMREALFTSRDLRVAVEETFIGKGMQNSLLGRVDAIVMGKLSQYYDMGLFNGEPPYWGYVKTVVGDQIRLEYNGHLTPPTNFIFITSHMHVYAMVA